jgi:hypothetical protein
MGADVWLIVNRQPTQPCAQLELFIERFNSKELHTRGGDGGNCMLKAVEVTFVNILQSHVTLHSNFIQGPKAIICHKKILYISTFWFFCKPLSNEFAWPIVATHNSSS